MSVNISAGKGIGAIAKIRNFLECAYNDLYQDQFPIETKELLGCLIECPQQSTVTDCGLFMCEFLESFFLTRACDVKDLRFPLRLGKWFNTKDFAAEKRLEIARIVVEKFMEINADNPVLPQITFNPDSV